MSCISRRDFSLLVMGTTLASALPGLPQSNASPSATQLYGRALVLDCNSGPPYEGGRLPLPQSALDLVRTSGVSVVKWSLGGINAGFAETVSEIAYVQRMVEVHPEYFMQVRVADDMQRAKRERKLGLILSFESAEMIEGKPDRIELFRNLGVRVMQLSYNRKSPFAAGVMEPNGGGLTTLGHEAVKRMNAVGVALDLSHANPQTTRDAMNVSTKPVVMTHAGCAAIHQHPRNKTDEQIRGLAAKGGVMGIYDLPYLTASPKQAGVADYMAHVEHALKIGGEDHVGIGSDVGLMPFDTSVKGMAEFKKEEEARQKAGLAAPEEDRPPYVIGLNTPRRIEVIAAELLKRGYPARVAEKVIGGNFVRVFTEIWG